MKDFGSESHSYSYSYSHSNQRIIQCMACTHTHTYTYTMSCCLGWVVLTFGQMREISRIGLCYKRKCSENTSTSSSSWPTYYSMLLPPPPPPLTTKTTKTLSSMFLYSIDEKYHASQNYVHLQTDLCLHVHCSMLAARCSLLSILQESIWYLASQKFVWSTLFSI